MKPAEIAFLVAVFAFAAAFTAITLSKTARVMTWEAAGEATSPGAGTARDVDTEKIRRLMEQGFLSDREALFYKKVGDSEPEEEQRAEKASPEPSPQETPDGRSQEPQNHREPQNQ